MDIETVREHQRLARRQMRTDFRRIQITLDMIGDQNHDHVGGFGGFGCGKNLQPGRFRLGRAFDSGCRPTTTLSAAVAQVQSVGVALAAVADNGDSFLL